MFLVGRMVFAKEYVPGIGDVFLTRVVDSRATYKQLASS